MICMMDTEGVGVLDGFVIGLVYREDLFASIMRENQDYILRFSMSKHYYVISNTQRSGEIKYTKTFPL